MNRGRYLVRQFPRATAIHRIAASLSPDLLALRTRRLSQDIVTVYGVSSCTAHRAIGMARRAAR